MAQSITLTSRDLRATISTHGARLETLSYQGSASLVLHADPAQHPTWRSYYPGAIVGPIANRVTGGRVPVNDDIYQMFCNENGITALHSGPDGLDQRDWRVLEQAESYVRLGISLADGAGGLPGEREIQVLYRVDGATLSLEITGTTDKPTPLNIAHHPYWRLGTSAAHLLQITAAVFLPIDGLTCPTGQIRPVAGTPFDHRIPKALDPSIDHNLCLADRVTVDPRHVATLTGAEGLALHIHTNQPGLQVYSGAHLPTLAGTDIAPFAGIALEPQGWPDAVNNPDFPNIIRTADHPYRQTTLYCIESAT